MGRSTGTLARLEHGTVSSLLRHVVELRVRSYLLVDLTLVVRDEVLKALETAREAKLIGKSAEAAVRMGAQGELRVLLESHAGVLEELFVVSRVELAGEGEAPPEGAQSSEAHEGLWALAAPAGGTKCPRCWLQREDGGRLASAPEVCGRCASVVEAMGVELDEA